LFKYSVDVKNGNFIIVEDNGNFEIKIINKVNNFSNSKYKATLIFKKTFFPRGVRSFLLPPAVYQI